MVMRQRTYGFTIVELLVVIVVIGVLATISTMIYRSLHDRALISTAQNDMASVKKSLMLYKAENGAFPISSSQLAAAKIKVTNSIYGAVPGGYSSLIYCVNTVSDEFAFMVRPTGSLMTAQVTSTMPVQLSNDITSTTNVCGLVGAVAPNRYAVTGFGGGEFASWLAY